MSHLALEAHDLDYAFDDTRVLAGARLRVWPGRRVALLGANGSGKTTLLRCLSGALRPGGGHVTVGHRTLRHDRTGLRTHRQEVQLVLQDPDDQLFSADVRRDVSFGPMNLGLDVAEVQARVEEALALLAVEDLADRPVHRLSYGQRKRVAIAGAVAMRPCLLLLDEPTAGLDPAGVDEVLAAIRRLEEHHTTVVLATHDVDLALAWADDVAIVHGGGVRQGDPVDLLGDPGLVAAARLRRPWLLELADRAGLPGAPPRTLDELLTRLAPPPAPRGDSARPDTRTSTQEVP